MLSQVLSKCIPILNSIHELESFLEVLVEFVIDNPIKISDILCIQLRLGSLDLQVLNLLVQRLNHTFVSFDGLNGQLSTWLILVVHGVNEEHLFLSLYFDVLIILLPDLGLKIGDLCILGFELLLKLNEIAYSFVVFQEVLFLSLEGFICCFSLLEGGVFTLCNLSESLAFCEHLFNVCLDLCSIVSTTLRSLRGVIAQLLEVLLIKCNVVTHIICNIF